MRFYRTRLAIMGFKNKIFAKHAKNSQKIITGQCVAQKVHQVIRKTQQTVPVLKFSNYTMTAVDTDTTTRTLPYV